MAEASPTSEAAREVQQLLVAFDSLRNQTGTHQQEVVVDDGCCEQRRGSGFRRERGTTAADDGGGGPAAAADTAAAGRLPSASVGDNGRDAVHRRCATQLRGGASQLLSACNDECDATAAGGVGVFPASCGRPPLSPPKEGRRSADSVGSGGSRVIAVAAEAPPPAVAAVGPWLRLLRADVDELRAAVVAFALQQQQSPAVLPSMAVAAGGPPPDSDGPPAAALSLPTEVLGPPNALCPRCLATTASASSPTTATNGGSGDTAVFGGRRQRQPVAAAATTATDAVHETTAWNAAAPPDFTAAGRDSNDDDGHADDARNNVAPWTPSAQAEAAVKWMGVARRVQETYEAQLALLRREYDAGQQEAALAVQAERQRHDAAVERLSREGRELHAVLAATEAARQQREAQWVEGAAAAAAQVAVLEERVSRAEATATETQRAAADARQALAVSKADYAALLQLVAALQVRLQHSARRAALAESQVAEMDQELGQVARFVGRSLAPFVSDAEVALAIAATTPSSG